MYIFYYKNLKNIFHRQPPTTHRNVSTWPNLWHDGRRVRNGGFLPSRLGRPVVMVSSLQTKPLKLVVHSKSSLNLISYICEKSKTFTNVCLRIILDNYFRLIFGHMTADALKVNESQNSCMLLTNKGIYLIKQCTNPGCCLYCLVKNQLLYSFNVNLSKPYFWRVPIGPVSWYFRNWYPM